MTEGSAPASPAAVARRVAVAPSVAVAEAPVAEAPVAVAAPPVAVAAPPVAEAPVAVAAPPVAEAPVAEAPVSIAASSDVATSPAALPAAPARPKARRAPKAKAKRGKKPAGRKLFQHDRRLGVRYVAGADEAGRGCLAGPLMAAGVLFDMHALGVREVRALSALNDSKQHSHEARERLYPLVLRCAARSVVISRSCESIDARGLHRTNLDALRDALARVTDGIPAGSVLCLVDGFRVPDFGREQRAIVDGDCTSAAIAAASILAKVARDRFMVRADERHPGWRFAEHKGYSSPVHREAILAQGVSPLHRMSFASTAYQQLAL